MLCLKIVFKKVWYANDATACGHLMDVHCWWDKLISVGPDFDYFLNPSKPCLVVNDLFYDYAVSIFQGSRVFISVEDK